MAEEVTNVELRISEVVVELGETNLWVTLYDDHRSSASPVLVQGQAPGQFPAHLSVSVDDQWSWGVDQRVSDSEVVVSGFLSRVDDPVPVVVGRTSVPAAVLVARQIAALLSVLPITRPARRLTLIHPVDLSRLGRRAIEAHLRARVPFALSLAWRSRAEAAVRALPECQDLAPEDLVGVLHVGGATTEAAVWHGTPTGGHASAAQVDWGYAGSAVDDALLSSLGTSSSRARARDACATAKERLSSETAVDIALDGRPRRIVRSEVEELAQRLTNRQLDALAAALGRVDASANKLRLLLLVGGAGAAPYLIEAASARFEVPVLCIPRLATARPLTPSATPLAALEARPVQQTSQAENTVDVTTAAAQAERAMPVTAAAMPQATPAAAMTRPAARPTARPTAAPIATPRPRPGPNAPRRVAVPARSGDSRGRTRRVHLPSGTHLAVAAAALVALGAGVPTALERVQSGGDRAAVADGPQGVGPALSGDSALGQLLPGGANPAPAGGSGGGTAYQVPDWLSGGSVTTTTLRRNQLIGAVQPAPGDAPGDGAPKKGRDTATPARTSAYGSASGKPSSSPTAGSSGGAAAADSAPAGSSGAAPNSGSAASSNSPASVPSSSSSAAPAPAAGTPSSSSAPATTPSGSDSPPATKSAPPAVTSTQPSTQSSPSSTKASDPGTGGGSAVQADPTTKSGAPSHSADAGVAGS